MSKKVALPNSQTASANRTTSPMVTPEKGTFADATKRSNLEKKGPNKQDEQANDHVESQINHDLRNVTLEINAPHDPYNGDKKEIPQSSTTPDRHIISEESNEQSHEIQKVSINNDTQEGNTNPYEGNKPIPSAKSTLPTTSDMSDKIIYPCKTCKKTFKTPKGIENHQKQCLKAIAETVMKSKNNDDRQSQNTMNNGRYMWGCIDNDEIVYLEKIVSINFWISWQAIH